MRTALALLASLASATAAHGQTLALHYKLDETSGTTCVDSSPNGIAGIYRNGYTLGQPGAAPGTVTSVEFDDLTMADVNFFTQAPLTTMDRDFTLVAWVNPQSLGQQGVMRILGNNGGAWSCGVGNGGLVLTTASHQDYNQAAGIPFNVWTHVAFVFDSAFDVTFYVNGQNVGTVTGTFPAIPPNDEWFVGHLDPQSEYWDGHLDDIQLYEGSLTDADVLFLFQNPGTTLGGSSVGTVYCSPAVPNSTGGPALITASGTANVAANDVRLIASGLPTGQFGYFLNSQTQGSSMPPASQGVLCLAGQIGRYNGSILNSGNSGQFELQLDLPNTPTPSGTTAVVAGQTWNFTCWYRDVNPGPTSNFTDGLEVSFL